MNRFIVPLQLVLDVSGFDKDDVYETLHAFADALRQGDFQGLYHLSQVFRLRPQFRYSDIQQITKSFEPPSDDLSRPARTNEPIKSPDVIVSDDGAQPASA